ncbi:hypothetical protein [Agrobacterium sp. 22-226-1]
MLTRQDVRTPLEIKSMIEREAKFVAADCRDDRISLLDLDRAFGSFDLKLIRRRQIHSHNLYYDTCDHVLARAGITLQTSSTDKGVLRVKYLMDTSPPFNLYREIEAHSSCSSIDLTNPLLWINPAYYEVNERVVVLTGKPLLRLLQKYPLREVASAQAERFYFQIEDLNLEERRGMLDRFILLVIDRVAGNFGQKPCTFAEYEVEVVDWSYHWEDIAARAAQALERLGLSSSPVSKYVRLYHLVGDNSQSVIAQQTR